VDADGESGFPSTRSIYNSQGLVDRIVEQERDAFKAALLQTALHNPGRRPAPL